MLTTATANAEGPHHEKGRHAEHDMPTFAEVDANADGFIVADELYLMHGKRMADRAAEGRKLRKAAKGPDFEKIDVDGDGKLTPEEFAAHQAQCRHARRPD